MKTIQTMIKINKNNLDIIASKVKELETKKDQLIEEIKNIDLDIETEQTMLHNNIEYKFTFDKFLKEKIERKVINSSQINTLNEEIDKLNQQKIEAFSEKAKFEILLENKIKQQKYVQNSLENKQNDEHTIIQVNRKKHE